MEIPRIDTLREGQRISASEYNRRGRALQNVCRSLPANSIVDSSGIHTRRPISVSGVTLRRALFEVQSAATGDGVYNCYEQKLIASYWNNTTHQPKFTERDETPQEVEVLNLMENFDPISGYVRGLGKYDRIVAWQMPDSGGTQRWIGVALAPSVRRFKTIESATANDHITCDMVLNDGAEAASGELGYHVEIYGDIYGSNALNTSTPRLVVAKYLYAEVITGKWRCVTPFDTDREDCICNT